MHWFLKLIACSALVVAIAQPSIPAQAQSAGDSIEQRRTLMRDNSRNLKVVGGYLKKGMGTSADVVRAGEAIAANAGKLAGLFPSGSSTADGVGKTRAKPAIWSDRGKFDSNLAMLMSNAMKLAGAGRSGDKGAIGAAMGALGKQSCGGCHRAFRAPRKKK